ncbi:MAG: hypothetical protein LIR50_15920 [Bacillota bacterium]|nr:hypothetical protein [Bacillota bacterium]
MLGNQVVSIISGGVLSIFGALASYGITVGVKYIDQKKQALIKQIGNDKYNANFNIAKNIYYEVEQQFRFIPDSGKQKADEFDKLLVKKIPGISQDDLTHFKEAICGKINSEVKDSQILAPAYDETKDNNDVVDINKSQETKENQIK